MTGTDLYGLGLLNHTDLDSHFFLFNFIRVYTFIAILMHEQHYYLFIDESGTQNQSGKPVDEILVLGGVLINKPSLDDYAMRAFALKSDYWTHPETVHLHSHCISKKLHHFSTLNANDYNQFVSDVGVLLEKTGFTLLCGCVDYRNNIISTQPSNTYHRALGFILERVVYNIQNITDVRLTIIIESRNKKQDNSLEQFMLQLFKSGSGYVKAMSFAHIRPEILFRNKTSNTCGLEISDLCAVTIRRYLLTGNSSSRAHNVVFPKLKKNPKSGLPDGWGLKVYRP